MTVRCYAAVEDIKFEYERSKKNVTADSNGVVKSFAIFVNIRKKNTSVTKINEKVKFLGMLNRNQ